jgi:Fic family protein
MGLQRYSYKTSLLIGKDSNGNGRCARLFTDLWLLSIGKEMLEWGDKNLDNVNGSRKEYISALQEVDSESYERLKRFIFLN